MYIRGASRLRVLVAAFGRRASLPQQRICCRTEMHSTVRTLQVSDTVHRITVPKKQTDVQRVRTITF
jgi:hypothetical protein